ncbi:MAG: hypothetical protein K8I82_29230, partial [Anaerolineae bacterium]|nr:hypothetical protein [Anaerolineae bacterium]
EKGLFAFLESIGEPYGELVALQSDGVNVTVAKRWQGDQIVNWWDETALGTLKSEVELAAIGAAVDTLTLTPDKTAIIPNGSDAVTITIQAVDTGFNGQYSYRITTPEGNILTGTDTLADGAGLLSLTTQQTGSHQIYIYAADHGTGRINIGTN